MNTTIIIGIVIMILLCCPSSSAAILAYFMLNDAAEKKAAAEAAAETETETADESVTTVTPVTPVTPVTTSNPVTPLAVVPDKSYKKLEGTTYPGLSGAPAGTNTVALCQVHCDSTSGCNGFVYHNGLNACWTTKVSTDYNKPVYDSQYTYYYQGTAPGRTASGCTSPADAVGWPGGTANINDVLNIPCYKGFSTATCSPGGTWSYTTPC